MAWCEPDGVGYLLGLTEIDRLRAKIREPMKQAEVLYRQSGKASSPAFCLDASQRSPSSSSSLSTIP
jgi:hypothetical protein